MKKARHSRLAPQVFDASQGGDQKTNAALSGPVAADLSSVTMSAENSIPGMSRKAGRHSLCGNQRPPASGKKKQANGALEPNMSKPAKRKAKDSAQPNVELPSAPISGQRQSDVLEKIAASEGHRQVDPQFAGALAQIRELVRARTDMLNATTRLTLQIKSIARRLSLGDKDEAGELYASAMNGQLHPNAATFLVAVGPLLEARALVEKSQTDYEKRFIKVVRGFPVYAWVKGVKGFGEKNLALIIGETGDLSNYSNPAKLWKRMGLAVIGDKRQQRVKGEDALVHRYSPHRRAIVWNLGNCVLKQQRESEDRSGVEGGRAIGHYGEIYTARKAYELARDPEMTPAHSHNRAKRYMEKRLIRDLWKAWRNANDFRAANQSLFPNGEVPHSGAEADR